MKKIIAAALSLMLMLAAACACAETKATLKSKMATRSGPGTSYTDLGTYFSKGKSVTAISKSYDEKNRVWWIEVEFKYRDTYRRAYTGHKRLNVSISALEEQKLLYTAQVLTDSIPLYGPGEQYESYLNTLVAGLSGAVYEEENGYVQFEYKSSGKSRRVWLPAEAVDAVEYPTTGESVD